MTIVPASQFRRADGTPRRVLYAEDQLTSRTVTKAMLERMGFEVDAVEDGELAVQRARNDNYDVILLDIEMPVMDGVTAARSIRQELEHCAATPILALSAFLADSTEHSAWRDAFDSALPKPANGNELFQAMDKAVKVHDERRVLPAQPSKQDMVAALKATLPAGVWRRISSMAASEMNHLINALAAADQAGDAALKAQIAHHLARMGSSFGADRLTTAAKDGSVDGLRQALAAWAG